MNSWGFEAFSNDAAVAWLDQLQALGLQHLRATIDPATGPQALSAEQGAGVVAAAAIVAGSNNPQFAERLPQHAWAWTQREELTVDAGLRAAAGHALTEATAEGSALLAYWRKQADLNAWQLYIGELSAVLGGAPSPQAPVAVPVQTCRFLMQPFNAHWSMSVPLQWLLGACGVLLAFAAIFGMLDIALGGTTLPANSGEMPLTFAAAMEGLALMLYIPIVLVAVVIYFIWVYRSHINLIRLGSFGHKYSPAMAVASFFIPFLNLYRPYDMMQDAYRASDPQSVTAAPDAWMHGRANYLIGWWWALFIATGLLGNITSAGERMSERGSLALLWLDVAFWAALAVESGLLLLIVKSIQERQLARFAALIRAATERNTTIDRYVYSLAEAYYRHYPGGKAPPPSPRPAATGDYLRREKFAFLGAGLLYVAGLIVFLSVLPPEFDKFQSKPPRQDAFLGIFFTVVGAIFYFLALWRTFFGKVHAEKWTCFGLAILMAGIAIAVLIGTHVYRDPASLAMYLLCIGLHGWLAALLVRDARRWRPKA